MKKLFFLVLLLVVAGAAAQTDFPRSGIIASDEQHAERFFAEGQWRQLELHAFRWKEKDGSNWKAWYFWGTALLRQGKLSEGAQALTTAQKLSPRINDRLWLVIAEAHEGAGDFESAETTYRTLLRKYKNRPEIWVRLLEVLAKQDAPRKREEESQTLAKVLTFAPYINDVAYWQRQVVLLQGLGDTDGVRNAQGHVLRLDAGNNDAAEWIFRYEIERGNQEEIDKIVERLQLINKNSPLARMYLGNQAYDAGRTKIAKWHYEAVQGADARYPRVRATALTRLAQIDPYRNKAETYKAAIAADPSYLPAWEGAVVALQAYGDTQQASLYLQKLGMVKRHLEQDKPITRELLADLNLNL